jgi:hypothetical protein
LSILESLQPLLSLYRLEVSYRLVDPTAAFVIPPQLAVPKEQEQVVQALDMALSEDMNTMTLDSKKRITACCTVLVWVTVGRNKVKSQV